MSPNSAPQKPLFNIVLYAPEIPQNTGTIGRSCIGYNSRLHLIKPYGFEISDAKLKRAGLDYWHQIDLVEYDDWNAFLSQVSDLSRLFLFSSKTKRPYFAQQFLAGDYFVFGPETKGLPSELLAAYPKSCLTIPFIGPIRSFNLSNAASMVMGEAFRQVHGHRYIEELS